ncbi:MAG: PAS domain S-box protein, partial [Steroidobacteraceae bacterium]
MSSAAAMGPKAPEATALFIVEDEALIAMELEDRLSELGYRIVGSAARGEDALAAIRSSSPDLVLMDVRLAGDLTGVEVASRLRETLDVPVIFLSAYSDTGLLQQAGTVEPFGYLIKPFEERELHASIQMALYRHRMEKALRESHARLEERVRERTAELAGSREDLAVTLDSIGDGVLATDALGRITRLNPVAEQLTGWREEEALGRPIAEVFRIINEVTRDPAPIPVDRVLATGERQSLANHTALITRHGAELSIADSAAPIRDAGGDILGVVLVFRDETEARQRRRLVARQGRMLGALRHLQEQFISSADAAVPFAEILAVLLEAADSPQGCLAEVRRAGGGPVLEVHAASGSMWREAAAVLETAATPDSGSLRGPAPARGPASAPLADGGRRLAARLSHSIEAREPVMEAAPIAASGIDTLLAVPIVVAGAVIGLAAVANRAGGYDDTVLAEIQPLLATYGSLVEGRRGALRRRAAEESLRELNAGLEAEVERRSRRFHDLFEFSPDAIVMTDRRGMITLMNRKAEALSGWSRGELVGRSVETLMPGQLALWQSQDPNAIGPDGVIAADSKAPAPYVHRRDGTHFPVEMSLGSIDTGDGVMLAAAIRDVTDRLNAERQANRAQRLESIGTLAGGIAHDLNNTLTPIHLALDTLKQQYPADSETLETLERSANHAAEMVRHLLAFAKGTEGPRVALHPRQLLEDMQKIIKGVFPKNISVRLRTASDLPTVLGDATQLHQVLLNLCVNARDAMPAGGTIALEAELAALGARPPDASIDPG